MGTVKANRVVEEHVRLIDLAVPGFDGAAEAGQFVMVKPDGGYDPFLRRPYSIFECGTESMQLLVKIVGKGSASLGLKDGGSKVAFLAPLGRGFPTTGKGHHILVAGGMGIAPLWFLAARLEGDGKDFSLIFGEQTRSGMGSMVESRFPQVHMTTDDGSRGVRGTATGLLVRIMEERDTEAIAVCGCGPVQMLERLAEIGRERGVPTYVSIEERMACGMGVCLGCSIEKKDGTGYTTVCREGPVFPAEDVVW